MGVDFVATGNTPVNWKLIMDLDQNFEFISDDGNHFIATPVNPSNMKDVAGKSYTTNVTNGRMTINIYDQTCNQQGFGKGMGKNVSVAVASQRYWGCGDFLSDNRLNNVWELDSIGNERQDAADYAKGLPYIQLDLNRKKLSGHDGCNNIAASFEVEGTRIRFAPFISTKMACKGKTAERIFGEYLGGSTVSYFLTGESLVLVLMNDSKLVFRKPGK